MNKPGRKIIFIAALLAVLISSLEKTSAQDATYYPKGNPDKWNVSLTPFFWIPWSNGSITSSYISANFNKPAIDLLKNVEMAFMVNAELSKGKFFISPTYIYNRVSSEQVVRTDKKGEDALVAAKQLTMNIAELITGVTLPVNKKFDLEPYLGCRYNNFKVEVDAEGKLDSTTVNETSDFWDPVMGLRANYFPHPRVPLSLRADVGGFGVGSYLSWTVAFNGGYSVSPQIDLLAGFNLYGFDYQSKSDKDRYVGLQAVFYGFDIGIRIILPKRFKDPSIYKKAKKG
ncbi:MAG: hypothetical protein NTU98_05580 [Bacteroidetes bacterium]|nr:hypothetical protein [Bacteroidota bacterium]